MSNVLYVGDVIKYNGNVIHIFDCHYFSHKMSLLYNQPVIMVQLQCGSIGYIGMCSICQQNWFATQHGKHKLTYHVRCHCQSDSTQECETLTMCVNVCEMCHYLSNIIIKFDDRIISSLHMCKCTYKFGFYINEMSSLSEKYSFKEEAKQFLENISLT